MKIEILATDIFEKEYKRLSKKYPSLKSDLDKLEKKILINPELGTNLGNNFRKIRVAIKSKNKGKRAGARIISYNIIINLSLPAGNENPIICALKPSQRF